MLAQLLSVKLLGVPVLNWVAAGAFAVTSWLAVILNKILMYNFHFNYAITAILVQILVSLGILTTCKYLHLAEVHFPTVAQMRKNWKLSVIFFLGAMTGLYSMTRINLAMFVVLRRSGVLFSVFFERQLLGVKHSTAVYVSLVLMMGGTVLASFYDLQFELWGYFIVTLANALQSLYSVLNLRVAKEDKLDNFNLMLLQSVMNLPLCALVALPELVSLHSELSTFVPATWLLLLVSSAWIFLLNYCSLLCTRVNSVVTTNVIGQMKNLLIILASYVAWSSDTPVNTLNIVGILVAILGSFYYMHTTFGKEKATAMLPFVTASAASSASPAGGAVLGPTGVTAQPSEPVSNAGGPGGGGTPDALVSATLLAAGTSAALAGDLEKGDKQSKANA